MTTRKTFTRLLSVLLLVCMLVSLAPAAYAEGTEPSADVESTEALPAEPSEGTEEPDLGQASTASALTAGEAAAAAVLPGGGTIIEPRAPSGSVKCNFYSNPPEGSGVQEESRLNQTVTNGELSFIDEFYIDGYKQTGWNTARDGSETAYAMDGKVTVASTLYAQWEVDNSEPTYNFKPKYSPKTLAESAYIKVTDSNGEISAIPNAPGGSGTGTKCIAKYASEVSIGEITGNDQSGYEVLVTVTLAHGDALEGRISKYFQSAGYGDADEPWTYDFNKTGTNVVTFTLYWKPVSDTGNNWYMNSTYTGVGRAYNDSFSSVLPTQSPALVYVTQATQTAKYTVTYTDGVDNEVVFEDQVYEDLKEGEMTPAFDGTPTRIGYTFIGWDPEVEETVTKDVTYTAQWEKLPDAVTLTLSIFCACERAEEGRPCDTHVDVYIDDAEAGSYYYSLTGTNVNTITVPYGAEVKLVATPAYLNGIKADTLFDGYFAGDELLSKELTYTIDSLTKDTDILAKFSKADQYVITFNGNGASVTLSGGAAEYSSVDAYDPGAEVSLAAAFGSHKFVMALTGDYLGGGLTEPSTAWRQIGWSYEKDAKEPEFPMDGTITMPSEGGDVTLYAVWESYEWAHWTFVTSEPDGVDAGYLTWGTSDDLHDVGDSFKAYVDQYGVFPVGIYCPIKAVANPGYKFVGWYINGELIKENNGIYTGDRDLFKRIGTNTPAEETTITAVFAAESYTVTFNPNGGTVNPETKDVTYGEAYGTLPNSTLNGLTADGWYLVDEDGNVTDIKITKTDLVSTARDHELFQKRAIKAPSVNISKDGGTNWSYYYNGSAVTLKATTYEYAYLAYSYQWYKNGEAIEGANGSTLVLDGNVSDSGTYKCVVTVTLPDGSTIVTTNESAAGEVEKALTIRKISNTLYQDFNGGEDTKGYKEYSSYTNGTSISVKTPTNAFSKTGYSFTGYWNTEPDGSGTSYRAGATYSFTEDNGNGGIKAYLYAQWEANEYTVTLNPNGGEVDPETLTVAFDSAVGELPTPTREGYSFDGWVDEDGNLVTADTVYTVADDSELTAQWTPVEYTVTVDPGNGEDPYEITITYEDTVGEKVEEPVREGYTFGGWVDQDGNPVDADAAYNQGIESLTAVWTANTYTLIFDANDGTAEPESKTVTYDQPIGDLAKATRKGYSFDGWYYADGAKASAEDVFKAAGDVTVTAKWTANTYTIRFDPNGGKVDVTEKQVIFGEKVGELPVPTKEGCTFAGWSDRDGNLYQANTIYSIDGDVALFACWIDPSVNPKTGDDANAWLYGALMLGSLAAAAYVTMQLKKRKEN